MEQGPPEIPNPEADPLVGRTIAGKFVIEHLLGAGSMGAVYQAQQIALERTVAIKVMRGGVAADETSAARFDLEAKAASRLDHPNVIQVFDYGQEPDGLLYIAMEFLACRDLLAALTEDWPLAHDRIVDILSQTLSALAAAHEAGVLHRDLKPENIMLVRRKAEDGTPIELVKVCDFGIAKLTTVSPREAWIGLHQKSTPASAQELAALVPQARRLTTGGLVVGTPEYMAPEQARGESFDARSDVYAVGVILYQLLTGRLPFEAKTPVEVVFKAMHEDPPPLRSEGPTAAPSLEPICVKAMSKLPEDRFQSAREMRTALRAAKPIVSEPVIRVENPGLPPPHAPRPRRWAWLGALLGAAVAFAASRRAPEPIDVTRSSAPPLSSAPLELPPPPTRAIPDEPASPTSPASSRPAPSLSPRTAERHPPRGPRRGAPVDPSPEEEAPLVRTPAPVPLVAPPPDPVAAPGVASKDVTSPPPPATSERLPRPAASPQFDTAAARVDLGTAKSNNAAATSSNVSRALRPLVARFTACYRSALAQALAKGGAAATTGGEAVAALHLESDESGYVTVARLTGEVLPGAGTCVETVSRSARIVVDTGTANADVALTFKPL